MDAGFLITVAASIVMYQLANGDHRRGWLWAAMTLVIITLIAHVSKLGIPAVFMGFFIAFTALVLTKPVKRR